MLPRPDDPTVSPERATALIERSFPALAPVRLEHLGRGWDHDVLLVNGAWVFRFPRNGMAALALQTELAVMPWLAPRLPLPIPVPVFEGVFDETAGTHFVGHRLIPGKTVIDTGLGPEARAALGPALGRFTRALHSLRATDAPHALPPDVIGRMDLAKRMPITQERLASLRRDGVLPEDTATRLLRLIEEPWTPLAREALVLVHADMHGRNLLVGADGALSGVIDWVDLHEGDPAVDLATAFEVLPPSAREAFFREYGGVDAGALVRARWRAITHMTAALVGSMERGDEGFVRSARGALLEMAVG
ncbi:phosphotransferase [Polyangium aurulentum]|uniref:phosphotransferase n=1 Tax=Polyangium aurulentum TaxID=2567896 RepID=UPI0010ADC11F|nr:phosphotransferase [Polyangium aurulentum]UQA63084.1 phosphotransferase [Polyangium aurulentum]